MRLKQVDRNYLGIVIASKAPCNGEAITQKMARLLLHDAFVGKPPRNDDGRWCLSRCYSVDFFWLGDFSDQIATFLLNMREFGTKRPKKKSGHVDTVATRLKEFAI